jgi:hypothetical protein
MSPPEHPTHLIPLYVCLSFVFSASPVTAQLSPVRFGNNQEQEKARSNKGAREKSCSNPYVLKDCVFIFIKFQELLDFMHYFFKDPLIIEQCIV